MHALPPVGRVTSRYGYGLRLEWAGEESGNNHHVEAAGSWLVARREQACAILTSLGIEHPDLQPWEYAWHWADPGTNRRP